MKLLVDMNLSPRWITFLADAGIEAAHCLPLILKTALHRGGRRGKARPDRLICVTR